MNRVVQNQNIRFYDRYWSPEILYIRNNSWFLSKNKVYLGFLDWNKIYDSLWNHCWWIENWVIRDLNWYSVAFMKWAKDPISPIFPIPRLAPLIWVIPIPPIKPLRKLPKFKPIKRFWRSLLSPLTLFTNGR